MNKTPNLTIDLLAPAQAQKHVTVNEAILEFDSLVQCAVAGMFRNDPPASAPEGVQYIVGQTPDAAWSGKAGRIASWRNGGWAFNTPKAGWRVYNLADDTLYVLTKAGTWTPLSGGGSAPTEIQNATRFGLGAVADAANPFVAKVNAALWTARGTAEGGTGDLFVTTNRSDASRSVGHVFQTGFVTRALAGLFGSDKFRVSVSPDGAAFRDALVIDDATGIADQPQLPRFKAHTNFDNFGALDTWTKIAMNTVEANEQACFDAGTSRFTAPVAGTYLVGATVLYKINTSSSARMRVRLVQNGTAEIRGSFTEISGAHVTLATAAITQTLVALAKDDTVEVQGYFRGADAFFAANHTSFWGLKVG